MQSGFGTRQGLLFTHYSECNYDPESIGYGQQSRPIRYIFKRTRSAAMLQAETWDRQEHVSAEAVVQPVTETYSRTMLQPRLPTMARARLAGPAESAHVRLFVHEESLPNQHTCGLSSFMKLCLLHGTSNYTPYLVSRTRLILHLTGPRVMH